MNTQSAYPSDCECENPGYCKRLHRNMVGRMWELCSGNCPPHRPCTDSMVAAYRRLLWSKAQHGPSVAQMALNFGKSLTKHVAGGMKLVEESEYQSRLEICRGCPSGLYYVKKGAERCRHRSCGCYLQKKLRWASESCPKGHWSKDESV